MKKNTKEENLDKTNSKRITVFSIIFVIAVVILVFLIFNVFQMISCKACLENNVLAFAEKNEKIIFNIDKITLFSSADTKNKTGSVTNFTIENLYQFTDMALYINNNSNDNKELTEENTLKSLKIDNIQFTKRPEIGQPSLYYKNLNDFAKGVIEDANKIEGQLNFEVSSENELEFDTPAIYNNCASPIVLSYVNENIKNDYTFTDTSVPITYDGSLLKRLEVPLESIVASISFDIYITNNLDQKFKTTVYLDIPLQSKERRNIY